MLRKKEEKQRKIFSGRIEDLMPKKHFLRELEKAVDFGFIYEMGIQLVYTGYSSAHVNRLFYLFPSLSPIFLL